MLADCKQLALYSYSCKSFYNLTQLDIIGILQLTAACVHVLQALHDWSTAMHQSNYHT